jgi:acylglycerol lipase
MDFSIALKNGNRLRGFFSVPSDNPVALIILLHGIGEHIKRYLHLAESFSSEGIGFLGVDLPGHGSSDGKRGHISGYSQFRELLGTLIDISEKTYPGVPVFLYGHSLGGTIALEYIIREKRVVKGAIITSPWLRLAFEPSSARRSLAAIMKNFLPGLVQPTGLNISHLSHNMEVVEKYKNDPLVHDKISVSLFYESITAAKYVLENAESLNIPVLLMHGSNDMITSPAASREFAERNHITEIKIWEGGFHELHNDIYQKEVFDYTMKWINRQL